MAGVVNTKDAHKPIIPQLESRNAAVRARDPHGFEFRRVEGAHEVQCEDADRAGVTEDCDLPAAISFDDLVQLFSRAIE